MNSLIQESCRWQDSLYLPDVTYKLLCVWVFKGFLCQLLLGYFFYKSWIAISCLIPITIILVYRQWQSWRRQVLLDVEAGFKEWLYYVKGGLGAGKSVEQAILGSKSNFERSVSAGHPVKLGLEQVYRGLELHMPVDQCIRKFGDETKIEVIEDFAIVFEITKKQGGRMSATLERTIQQIYDKIELRQEIHAMVAAKKLEQRIMCIMPLGVLFFVGKTSGGYFEPLYHNLQGTVIMTFCMCVYLFGVWWGERMTEV